MQHSLKRYSIKASQVLTKFVFLFSYNFRFGLMNSMLQTYNIPSNQTKILHNNESKFNAVNQAYKE